MIEARKIPNLPRILEFLSYNRSSGLFTWKVGRKGHTKPGMIAGTNHNRGYITIRFDGIDYLAHRLAWAFVYGDPGPQAQIDHVNGDRSDNRITNLRLASHAENCRNSKPRSHNKSGIKGVRKMGGKWAARIRVNSRELWLGSYDTPEAAKAAYDAAAEKYHGTFAQK